MIERVQCDLCKQTRELLNRILCVKLNCVLYFGFGANETATIKKNEQQKQQQQLHLESFFFLGVTEQRVSVTGPISARGIKSWSHNENQNRTKQNLQTENGDKLQLVWLRHNNNKSGAQWAQQSERDLSLSALSGLSAAYQRQQRCSSSRLSLVLWVELKRIAPASPLAPLCIQSCLIKICLGMWHNLQCDSSLKLTIA